MAQGTIMRLGNFIFSVSTATYDSLMTRDEWRWVTQERLNNVPAEQYIGRGSTMKVLDGTVYPLYQALSVQGTSGSPSYGNVVGTGQIDALRALANAAQPVGLVDGTGKNFGEFVIVSIDETQTYVLDNGAPRKQDFKITLRSFGPDDQNLVNAASAAAVSLQNTASSIITGLTPTANDAQAALAKAGAGAGAIVAGALAAVGVPADVTAALGNAAGLSDAQYGSTAGSVFIQELDKNIGSYLGTIGTGSIGGALGAF